MKTEVVQPVLGRESLEEIATVALGFGRLLMETGASARNVEEIIGQVAAGLVLSAWTRAWATRRSPSQSGSGPIGSPVCAKSAHIECESEALE